MIVKKVKAKGSKKKGATIRDLVEYIRETKGRKPGEKVLYSQGRGFLCEDAQSQQEEMRALASEAVRSKNPIVHYVLSWREGEQPSREQVEEAVSLFLEELGMKEHQAIYALHKDTDNLHLHLAVNRVHPETLKVIKPNKGFDIEAAHKAVARIEHVQGWQREANGRYQVLENGEIGREVPDPTRKREPEQSKRDLEHRTGEKSAERRAMEEAGPIFQGARSWQELHRELEAKGMKYERTGSGGKVRVGGVWVKGSRVERGASLRELEKRLGKYEPPREEKVREAGVEKREAKPIQEGVKGWEEYIGLRKAHYEAKREEKEELWTKQGQERKEMWTKQRRRREEILQGKWKGKGELLNALRSVLAEEQAGEKAALKERHKKEREKLYQKYRPYPDLEQWQREKNRPEIAEEWRHRASEPGRLEGEGSEETREREIRGYVGEVVGKQVEYRRVERGGRGGGGVSFVDKGSQIDVYEWRDQRSLVAAMQLGAQKWGSLHVKGSEAYKEQCVKVAAVYGFKLKNAELQERVEQERQKRRQEREEAMKSEQLRQFEKYHEAVGAERYRVTCIRMTPDGGKLTFILGKAEGITQGFTPQEMAMRMGEMQRLQKRGENVYYTPLSETKHHILIDDMSREKLEQLVKDGYKPAVVMESSPGNYQAILTVEKLGTEFDREVGNRLAERLNQQYGDPKLSGCIHPHRAPGYENRKPKHQREDGSYPEVRLLKAEKRQCAQTLALARQIEAEYPRQAEPKAAHGTSQAKPVVEVSAPRGSAAQAYAKHYADVVKRQNGSEVDWSRVDAMIAMRLRITGHSQQAIEGALRQCAPGIRPQAESRDWNDYAQRTARYATSAAGDRQAKQLEKYRGQWEQLEGREGTRLPEKTPKLEVKGSRSRRR